MEIPENFCVVPWTSIWARVEGYMGPCNCSSTFYRSADGEYLRLNQSLLSEGFHSPTAHELRRNMLAGIQDPGCAQCWRAEARGQKSKRMFENENFAAEALSILGGSYEARQPVNFDLSPGNACNLKCRICGPDPSSSWEKEARDLQMPGIVAAEEKGWAIRNKKFWAELESWLPEARKLNFTGGEPFLSLQHYALLEKSVEDGSSAHQELYYNSNGTIFPSRLRDLFPRFKRVQILLSLDDLGERFEYQRHGARWQAVLENFNEFRKLPKVETGICVTVSALNIYYLLDILDFWLERDTKVYLGQIWNAPFELHYLPRKARQEIIRKLERADLGKYETILLNGLSPFVELLKKEVPENLEGPHLEALRLKLQRHDLYRNESYARTFPEAAQLYGL